MKRIIVIFGGVSPEHDVSVVTGVLALNCLDKSKFIPVPVYVNKKGEWFTGDKLFKLGFFKEYSEKFLTKVNLIHGENFLYKYRNKKPMFAIAGAVNCMHGGMGENGTIGALFSLCGIPCNDSNIFSSSVGMDKEYFKIFLKSLNVDYVEYVKIYREDFYGDKEKVFDKVLKTLNFPVIVKPSSGGSSIGINVAKDKEELFKNLIYAFKFDGKVIVEKYIEDFTEINCAVYRKKGEIVVSELEKPTLAHEILTFKDKYFDAKSGLSLREFPAKVPSNIESKIKETTLKIYRALEFTSVVRMDYIVKDGIVYLNEINTIPGSLSYYLFYDTTSGLTDLLTDLLEESFKNHLSKKSSLTEYSSNLLSFKGVALKK